MDDMMMMLREQESSDRRLREAVLQCSTYKSEVGIIWTMEVQIRA